MRRLIRPISWISPLAVYRAASCRVRRQVWITAAVYLGMGAMPVFASDTQGAAIWQEWLTPQTVAGAVGAVYGGGMLVQELRSIKKRLSEDEHAFARIDVVDLRFTALMNEIAALRSVVERNETGEQLAAFVARFEAYLQTVQTWSNRVESEIHSTQKDIVRLSTKVERI